MCRWWVGGYLDHPVEHEHERPEARRERKDAEALHEDGRWRDVRVQGLVWSLWCGLAPRPMGEHSAGVKGAAKRALRRRRRQPHEHA